MSCLVALALVKLGSQLVQVILGPVTHVPFAGGVVKDAENAINSWLGGITKTLTRWTARWFNGVVDSLILIVGVIFLLFVVQIDLVKWLYKQATGAFGFDTVKKLAANQNNAGAKATAAATAAAASLVALKAQVTKLEQELAKAGSSAATATEAAKVPVLQHDLTQLGKHVATVEATLTALRKEVTVIEQTKPAAVPVPAPVAVPGATGATGAQGAQGAAGREGTPGTAGAAGVAGAPGIGIGDIDLPGLGSMTAGVAIATTYAIVNTLVNEAGLSRAECRAKVGQICGTDPLQWASLLAGLAAVGVGFSLGDILEEAANMVGEVHGLLDDMSAGVIEAAPTYGAIIGNVANGIAKAA